jgi:hypothetical protein
MCQQRHQGRHMQQDHKQRRRQPILGGDVVIRETEPCHKENGFRHPAQKSETVGVLIVLVLLVLLARLDLGSLVWIALTLSIAVLRHSHYGGGDAGDSLRSWLVENTSRKRDQQHAENQHGTDKYPSSGIEHVIPLPAR